MMNRYCCGYGEGTDCLLVDLLPECFDREVDVLYIFEAHSEYLGRYWEEDLEVVE